MLIKFNKSYFSLTWSCGRRAFLLFGTLYFSSWLASALTTGTYSYKYLPKYVYLSLVKAFCRILFSWKEKLFMVLMYVWIHIPHIQICKLQKSIFSLPCFLLQNKERNYNPLTHYNVLIMHYFYLTARYTYFALYAIMKFILVLTL